MSVVVPVVVREVGLNVAVTFAGTLLAENVTVEASPDTMVKVTVLVTLAPPRVAVKLDGEADRVKLCTVNVRLVVRVIEPFVPVTVRV